MLTLTLLLRYYHTHTFSYLGLYRGQLPPVLSLYSNLGNFHLKFSLITLNIWNYTWLYQYFHMNNFKQSTNTAKKVNVLGVGQWTLADELNGFPLGLRSTTLLISDWLNINSVSCFHNSTSSDIWPLIGQKIVLLILIPAKEYYFLCWLNKI